MNTALQPSLTAVDRLLEASEARLHALLEVSIDGVWIFDREGRVSHANPAMCRLPDREAREVLGHVVYEFLPTDIAEEVRRRLATLEPARPSGTLWEFRVLRRDGSVVEVEAEGRLIRQGEAIFVVSEGELSVRSEPGHGSEFMVDLPTAQPLTAAPVAPASGTTAAALRTDIRGRVLYIEDDEVNRLLMYLPCVALSADVMPGDIAAAQAAGMNAYLTKPVAIAQLLSTLDAALSAGRPLQRSQ